MTSENQRPGIYVIAGPNGAGKTTFASRFLPEYVHCTEFLNADLIAAGLSPFDPESQNIRASELMLERMDGLVERRETFSFETEGSSAEVFDQSTWKFIEQPKGNNT